MQTKFVKAINPFVLKMGCRPRCRTDINEKWVGYFTFGEQNVLTHRENSQTNTFLLLSIDNIWIFNISCKIIKQRWHNNWKRYILWKSLVFFIRGYTFEYLKNLHYIIHEPYCNLHPRLMYNVVCPLCKLVVFEKQKRWNKRFSPERVESLSKCGDMKQILTDWFDIIQWKFKKNAIYVCNF